MSHSRCGIPLTTAAGVAVVLAAVLLVLLSPGGRVSAQAAAVERIVPASQAANAGDTVSTDVTIEGVSNLGAFEAIVTYDSALIAFASAANGPFLGSSGRTVFCVPPVTTAVTGTVMRVRYGCVTSGTTPPGASGSGLLATLTWTAVAPGDALLALTPSLADELGAEIPATAVDGMVHVTAGPTATPTATATACPGACPTDTPTSTPAATPTPSSPCGATVITVCVSPATASATNGTTFDVAVAVEHGTGVAAFDLTLDYDNVLLAAVAAGPGPFLSSTGRTLLCLTPTFAPSSVRLTCVTLGSTPAPPDGSGVIAVVSFSAIAEGTTSLGLPSVVVTGLNGNVLPAAVAGGSRTVAACAGPCPTATFTATATATSTATATATATATSTPCAGPCPTSTPTLTPTLTPTSAPTNTPAPPGPLTLRVDPITQAVVAGSTFSVDVAASGTSDLGGYEVGLLYDPAVLTVASVQDGQLLGSTGRTVSCPSSSLGPGMVRLACVTLGPQPGGASGSGMLARFNFVATATGTSALTLTPALIVGRTGVVQTVATVTDGSANVAPCAPTCPTPTATPAGPTATPTPASGMANIGTSPPAIGANVGDTISVQVVMTNAQDLGAYDALLEYAFDDLGTFEPNVLEFVDVTDGGFLGSSGRIVTCLPPLVDLLSVRIGCVTSGPAPPGPSGSGVLATVRFRVLKEPFRPMLLRIAAGVGGPADRDGAAQPFTANGTTTVTIAAPLVTGDAPSLVLRGDGDGEPPAADSARGALTSVADRAGAGGPMALALALAVGTALGARRRRGLAGAGLLSAIALAILPASGRGAVATSPAQVTVAPASVNAFAGGVPARVEVRVASMPPPGLQSFELHASFNDGYVMVSAAEGPFLGSTGNASACSVNYPSLSQIHVSCTASGSTGPIGDGVLAVFDVEPRASLDLRATNGNSMMTALDVSGVILRDFAGAAAGLPGSYSSVVAVRALEGDVNHDCRVDATDDEFVLARYYRDTTMPGYDPALDIEPSLPDGDIDLADLQFALGRTSSTCDAPIPPQAPPEITGAGSVDVDGDGCSDAKEPSLVPATDAANPWDFFSVPAPALIAAPNPLVVFRDGAVGASDAQSVFAYFKLGAKAGSPVYQRDLNANGVIDGVEYDRSVVGPGQSGPPDGVIAATDAQLAFAQFKRGYHC